MKWSELNLNRFGFKSEPDPVDAGSTEMSDSVGSSVSPSVSESGSPDAPGAKEVITGTLVTKCIVQTSNSADRVELSSFFTLNGDTIKDDSLVAYNNGEVIVVIDKDGIELYAPTIPSGIPLLQVFGDATIDNLIATDIQVSNIFEYQSENQPQTFYGRIDSDGSILYLPFTGWTVSHTPASGVYTITHNFGDTNYSVNISEFYAGGGATGLASLVVTNLIANSFDVEIWDIATIAPQDVPFSFSVFREV